MNIFFLAPNFDTLGGFELQLMLLSSGLAKKNIQTHVFTRKAVKNDHPYLRDMRKFGVNIYAPPEWVINFIDPPPSFRQSLLSIILILFSPLIFIASLIDSILRRRSLSRSIKGGFGKLRGLVGIVLSFDTLTWLMDYRLDRVARKFKPDIIDVQHSMLPQGITYAKSRGFPTIYTEYGAPSEDLCTVWSPLCPVINQVDHIIIRSYASIQGLRRMCSADRPYSLVPNAVTLIPENSWDCELPTNKTVTILYIGRLSKEKGPQYLLRAFKLLLEQDLPVRLVLAGDGPLRAILERGTREFEISEKTTFLGSFDHLSPHFRSAHIVAHPTLNDGRSIAVLEAMAWGRPVVASNVGGIPEIVEDGVNGFLVKPASPVALAAGLRKLILDPHLREKMGHASRRKFLEGGYTQDSMVASTLKVYQAVLKGTL